MVHAALREVLGPTALQSGSYNRPGYLRLDFGWTSGLSARAGPDIEQVSNHALRADLAGRRAVHDAGRGPRVGRDGAVRRDVRRREVRVVEIGGPWSRELCGGTHVEHSSQVGTIVVTGESSVGSGVRRVEALVGVEAFGFLAREHDVVAQLTEALKARPERPASSRVDDLVERLRAAEKEIEKVAGRSSCWPPAGQLAAAATDVDGVSVVAHRADGAGARRRAHARARRARPAAAGPARRGRRHRRHGPAEAGSRSWPRSTTRRAARGVSANALVRAVGPLVGGKGGGKDDVAQGGGTDASRIDEALALVGPRGRAARPAA